MAHLEIAYLTGDVETRELTKQHSISIGSHKSNDLCIDEAGVELMHCRISWNKNGYEAVAAGVEPLDVNGTAVQRAMLKAGDVLRFGTVDVAFHAEGEAGAGAAGSQGAAVALKPLTEEVAKPSIRNLDQTVRTTVEAASASPIRSSTRPSTTVPRSKAEKPASPAKPGKAVEPLAEILDDFDEVDAPAEDDGQGWAALAAESRVDVPARGPVPGRAAPPDDEESVLEEPVETDVDESEGKEGDAAAPITDRIREAIHHTRERPGEEDSLRSPLVLGLGGLAAVILLLAAVFYFIGSRRSAEEEFAAAKAFLDEGKTAQAIKALEEFADLHPSHALEHPALVLAGLARVDRHITGGVKDWEQGLEETRNFIQNCRDYEDFEAQHPEIWHRAGDIAKGAADTAGKSFDRKSLDTSNAAIQLVTTYAPKDDPPTALLDEIKAIQRRSEALILKHETSQGTLTVLDQALKEKQPMAALEARRNLLVRYPEFADDRQVAAKLKDVLETERSLVSAEQLERAGIQEDRPAELPAPLSLIFHARSRTDEVSVGQAVCVLSKDCCYGIDTMTSEPIWRRVIGPDTPFFPIREPSTPSLVLFDTVHQELVRVHQNTGALLWRQPIGEAAYGVPLIDEGQIYLPTVGGHLYKIDLATGTVSTRLTFSQAITGPVALADGQHLVVAGDQEVVYTLTKRPLECAGVSYLAQRPQTILAPLLAMGPYVLVIENGAADSSRLHLLSAADALHLTEVAANDVQGQVLDTPVIRGRDLFIPSTRERVTAFTVSDDAGQPPLLLGPTYQTKGEQHSAIYLATGPDGQVWMTSSDLRKLQLRTGAIEADQQVTAVGLASQPLQSIGGMLFHARRRPYTDAVTLTQTNRDDLTSAWQAVVGARIIAWSATNVPAATLVCVTEAGHPFRINEAQFQTSGFFVEGSVRLVPLPLNPELAQPLLAAAMPDGQIAVAAGAPEPKVWVLSKQAAVDRAYNPGGPLQAPPATLGSRLVFPVPGKLEVSAASGQPPIQEYALPSDQAAAVRWKQVLSVDANNVIALTEQGHVIQVRLQTSPRSHLAEIARVDLGGVSDLAGDIADGLVVVPDAAGGIRVFDATNLDARGQRTLDAAVSNDLFLAGGVVFAEAGGTACHALDPADNLKSRWPQPLELGGVRLAGRPVVMGDRVLIAQVDGTVSAVDLATGQVKARVQVGSVLAGGGITVGSEIFVATLDGSLVRVTQLAEN